MADRGSLQILLKGLLGAEDQPLGDLDHLPLAAMLDHLSIDQIGMRLQVGLARPSRFACAREYPPAAEVLEDSILILRPLVTEEDMQGAIIDRFGPPDQLICLLLGNLSYNEGGDDAMLRSEAQPDPAIAIFALERILRRGVRPLFHTKLQNSSSCTPSKCRLTIR